MSRNVVLLAALVLVGGCSVAESPTPSEARTAASPVDGLRGAPEYANRPVQSHPADRVAVPLAGAPQRGLIAWAEPDHGGDYLATRFPVGTLVRLCAKSCIVRRTNDFGPVGRSKIADLAVLDWEQICELPRSRGVCPGTIETVENIVLPATDMEGE